jgi:hypothetical protein
MDVFISHSSRNLEVARRIERELEARGLEAWLDDSELRLGVMLSDELQRSIRGARSVLLLWSKDAARSRWCQSEWLTAVHLGRFIIPVAIDRTKVPQCLENDLYLRVARVTKPVIERLARDVRAAPDTPNRLAPMLAAQGPELTAAIGRIGGAQQEILELIGAWKLADAEKRQLKLNPVVKDALRRWRLDPRLQTVVAYHLKNAYMLCHWDAIQAGQGPKDDPLLVRAERRFFRTLAIDPWDPEALNGLGSILMFRRNLDAAAFFITAAIDEAKRRGWQYPDAEQDLALVRSYQRR